MTDRIINYLDSSFHDGQDLYSDRQDHKLSVMILFVMMSYPAHSMTDRIMIVKPDSSFHDGQDL